MRENRLSGSMQGRREKQRNWQLRPVKSLCLTRLLYCGKLDRFTSPARSIGGVPLAFPPTTAVQTDLGADSKWFVCLTRCYVGNKMPQPRWGVRW